MSATPSEEGHTPHPQAQGQAPEREQQTTLFSHEEMSEQSEIPIAVWRTYVNLADWDKDVNINDAPTATELTTYFVRTLMEAIWLKQTGKEVRSSFREDLAGWSIYQFDQINRTIKKRMLQLLEQDQVTIPGATMSAKLARVLDSNAPPRITQQTTTFAGREEQTLHEIPLRPRLPQPIPSIEVSPQPYGAEDAGRAEQIHTMSPGARTTQEVWSYPQPAYGNRTTATPMPVDEYDLPPSKPVESKPLDPAKISAFQKGWRSARNYTGKPYDILYDKARIFISFCHRLQIDESQYHAVFPDILSERAEDFYINHIGPHKRWDEVYNLLNSHFNTNINHSQYFTDWTSTDFVRMKAANPDKTMPEVLELMLDKLQLVQRALGPGFQGEVALYTAVARACRGVKELENALLTQKPTCEALFADLRASLQVAMDRNQRNTFLTSQDSHDINFTDRRYFSNNPGNRTNPRPPYRHGQRTSNRASSQPRRDKCDRTTTNKRCFVCKKEGCWSSNHPKQEQSKQYRSYIQSHETLGTEPGDYGSFLAEFEGTPPPYEIEEEQEDDELQEIQVQYLQDQAYLHRTTGEDIYQQQSKPIIHDQFLLQNAYSTTYQGELWDTGAARVSTVGKCQVEAYLRENPRAKISWKPGTTTIRFGGSEQKTSIGTITKINQLGNVTYHILDTPTPFLFSLHDADRLQAYFNNVDNLIVRADGTTIPVIRKWGHPFFNPSRAEAATFFSEQDLRRLHRRFGHPRTERLYKLLQEAGHQDVRREILEKINKMCHHCQTHDPAPKRFKFTIKDNCEFNYQIVADIVQLNGRNVLHVIDVATSFQAAAFVRSLSAKDTWDALCRCWIYVYQGPPDIISHDPGTNFSSEEFKNNAKVVGISCKEMPVEAHWAVGKVERAHPPLRRSYDILKAELGDHTGDETLLQMAIKALNDTAGPNGLVPTLLVFGAYPRINQDSPPSPDIVRRAEAVNKAMKMLRSIRAEVDLHRAFNTRNGPSTHETLKLSLGQQALVWREKKGWTGPYRLQAIDNSNAIVHINGIAKTFRTTHIKPYYQDEQQSDTVSHDHPQSQQKEQSQTQESIEVRMPSPSHEGIEQVERRRPGRPRKHPITSTTATTYISDKERNAWQLALALRAEGKITTPGAPFDEAIQMEIEGLVARGTIVVGRFKPHQHMGFRLWKTRMVLEVKGKTTDHPYEKARLVVQGYNDQEKHKLLTQAPTIQRMSQRLIFALAPTLMRNYNMTCELRDITQAYVQSQDKLSRTIIARPPKEMEHLLPKDAILEILGPLYGIAESGTHWWKTYHSHHRERLGMIPSSYDPCLLITTTGPQTFALTGMQTDDTFTVASDLFSQLEEEQLHEAKLQAKPKTKLSHENPLEFNGTKLQLTDTSITMTQKGQLAQLSLVDHKAITAPHDYVSQRARGAYVATICQPEAAYDLSVAAQTTDPTAADISLLNARLQWQMDNPTRGLTYLPLDLARAKLFIFTDGSFANNKDMTSQLGYLIVLATESRTTNSFTIEGNIVHWSSSKCKRVTRSVLASELYGMTIGFDHGFALKTTLDQITTTLNIPNIPTIVCTDSKSLYECLVKLGSTTEKRLMVDIMSLRESYENREISEVRWINGKDNPADALTKKSPNNALSTLVSTNRTTVKIEAYVERM